MKAFRWLPIIAAGVLLAKHFGVKMDCVCEHLLEKLPDRFPPKWIYLNITAIREQNDRIIALLEEQTRTSK